MEKEEKGQLFSHVRKWVHLYSDLRYVFMFAFLAYLFWKFWNWRKFVPVVNKLPMAKFKFYHILGHVQFSLYARMRKRLFPPHVYDCLVLNGYLSLFIKENIAAAWALYRPVIFLYKADSVEAILNQSTELRKAFVYRFTHSWLGTGLLTSDGEKWRNRRKLLTPAFHFNILRDFLPVFNKQSRILVEILNNHTSDEFVDILPFITRCSLDIICESILGAEMNIQRVPENLYLKSIRFLTNAISERAFIPFIWPDFLFKISPMGRKFFKHLKHIDDFTHKLIRTKKERLRNMSSAEYSENTDSDTDKKKRRALMDLLLDEHIQNNALSEADIREEINTFTFEGHDTTSMAMSWALYLIGLHPGIQENIHQELDSIFGDDDRNATVDDLKEMKYLECVFKEAHRLYPSVPIIGRKLQEDFEFQGRILPKGSEVMVVSYFLHRNPDIFPNPEKFCPERFFPENCLGRHPFAYIPFSAGPRNCIGQRFALMEQKTVLSSILRQFKIRSLDPRDKVQTVMDIVLKPVGSLRLEIRPRDYKPSKPVPYFYYP